MIGQTTSHYPVLSRLGRGGMVVYEAEDLKQGARSRSSFFLRKLHQNRRPGTFPARGACRVRAESSEYLHYLRS